MTLSDLFSAILHAHPPRCAPGEHLVTVVPMRRLREGLTKRYWIRCELCGLHRGPYTDWQAAWLDASGAHTATGPGVLGREPSPRHRSRPVGQ